MPQLPSGRKIAIDATRLNEMAELNAQTVQRYPIHRVKTLTDLYPFIDVIFFKETPEDTPATVGYAPGAQNLEEIAPLYPYRSGFTLATLQDELPNWSAEDQQAFADFLQEPRTQIHLQELLDTVLDSQRRKPPAHIPPGLFGNLTGDQVMDMFWDLAQQPAGQETPPTPRPAGVERDDYDLLAALCRMNGLQEFAEWQTRFPDVLAGLEAFLQRLRDDHPSLSVWLQYWLVAVDEFAGRMRGSRILERLRPETRAWFALQAPQQALALQVLFANPEIAQAFAPERALLECAALHLTPAGSA